MSKSTQDTLAGLVQSCETSRLFTPWGPSMLHADGVGIEAGEDSAGRTALVVKIEPGAEIEWVDMIGDGAINLRVMLGSGSSLSWFCQKLVDSKTSARRVEIEMAEGSSLTLVEAMILGPKQRHGESVCVSMQGSGCQAKLIGRWAQDEGSVLCQETMGHIRPEANGSVFEQSSKALRVGVSVLTQLEPNIKVEIDDAVAKHGAAHGSVDELALHALLSRGLDRGEASRMLVSSFIGQAWQLSGASEEVLIRLGSNEENRSWS